MDTFVTRTSKVVEPAPADTIAVWISLLFFLQIAKWHFYIFSIFEISKQFDTAALLFSLFCFISCKLLWHSCTFVFFIFELSVILCI